MQRKLQILTKLSTTDIELIEDNFEELSDGDSEQEMNNILKYRRIHGVKLAEEGNLYDCG